MFLNVLSLTLCQSMFCHWHYAKCFVTDTMPIDVLSLTLCKMFCHWHYANRNTHPHPHPTPHPHHHHHLKNSQQNTTHMPQDILQNVKERHAPGLRKTLTMRSMEVIWDWTSRATLAHAMVCRLFAQDLLTIRSLETNCKELSTRKQNVISGKFIWKRRMQNDQDSLYTYMSLSKLLRVKSRYPLCVEHNLM